MDIAFVLDSSGSMKKDNWTIVKNFAVSFIDRLHISPDHVRVGVIVFSNDVRMSVPLGSISDKEALKNKVRGLAFEDSWTDTVEALQVLREKLFKTSLDRPNIKNYVVLLTDGDPQIDGKSVAEWGQRAIEEAQKCKDDGMNIFVVGVGERLNKVDSKERLKKIATAPSQAIFTTDFSALNEIIPKITSTLTCPTTRKYDV